jgi:hypothetical protein
VHGWISLALAPIATGYRLYFAVYVLPVSWLTRPYLMAIEPFRRLLYPAMLNRIRRAWIAAYCATACSPDRTRLDHRAYRLSSWTAGPTPDSESAAPSRDSTPEEKFPPAPDSKSVPQHRDSVPQRRLSAA